MSAILQHQVAAVNTPPVVGDLCAFGAVPVGQKFLYWADISYVCPGQGEVYDSAVLGLQAAQAVAGTSNVLYSPAVLKTEYWIKLRNGCIVSASAAFNMSTAAVVEGSAAAVIVALQDLDARTPG